MARGATVTVPAFDQAVFPKSTRRCRLALTTLQGPIKSEQGPIKSEFSYHLIYGT